MERKKIGIKIMVVIVILGITFGLFVGIKNYYLKNIKSSGSEQHTECLGKAFVIRGEFSRFDPSQMIMAIYLENTGVKNISVKKVEVDIAGNSMAESLKHPIIIKSGEGKYVYINLTAFFRNSNGKQLINDENGPEKIVVYGDCNKAHVLKRPPLGWVFFSYDGDEPLIPEKESGAT